MTSFASLSSDDENDNSDVGLSVFASPVTLKQELADEPRDANGEHVDSQQFGVSGAGLVGAEAAVDGNGVSSDIGSSTSNEMVVSSLMTSPKQRGMVWNEQKWARFNEFIGGMLSVSPFQAADVWLPVAQGAEDAETKASRLFLFNSNIQVRVFGSLAFVLAIPFPFRCSKIFRGFPCCLHIWEGEKKYFSHPYTNEYAHMFLFGT